MGTTVGWFGAGLPELQQVKPDSVEETEPTADALRQLGPESGARTLALAVQCKARGGDELAAELYARARLRFAEEKSDCSPLHSFLLNPIAFCGKSSVSTKERPPREFGSFALLHGWSNQQSVSVLSLPEMTITASSNARLQPRQITLLPVTKNICFP